MVNLLPWFSVVAAAVAENDDSSVLLQMQYSAHQAQQSAGHRIFTALAEANQDVICVQAMKGERAPIAGTFIAGDHVDQEKIAVESGAVAEQDGSFCVDKRVMELLQRSFQLDTAQDFESMVQNKKKAPTTTTTTTTTTEKPIVLDPKNPNWNEKHEKVRVEQCPKVSLVQTAEATVARKHKKVKLGAKETAVCECRDFMKEGMKHTIQHEGFGKVKLLQTSSAKSDRRRRRRRRRDVGMEDQWNKAMSTGCRQTAKDPTKGKWGNMARFMNSPLVVATYKKEGMKSGWEKCHKGWIIEGACYEVLEEAR